MSNVSAGPSSSNSPQIVNALIPAVQTVAVNAPRLLSDADDNCTLECTNGSITLTVPVGLKPSFGCVVIPNGSTVIASLDGTLLNGTTASVSRSATTNSLFGIVARVTALNSYVVTGT